MKSDKERLMEHKQAEVRRLKRELEAAHNAADKAWMDYVNEGVSKREALASKPLPSGQGIP